MMTIGKKKKNKTKQNQKSKQIKKNTLTKLTAQ